MKSKAKKQQPVERCALCDCILHRGRDYAADTPSGRAHATHHHFVAERFFGRSAISDAATHIHWLGRERLTTYDGELAVGMRFTRVEKGTGLSFEGEVVAMRAERFLKVRVDPAPDRFVTTEYHLLSVTEGCAVRVLCEVYDTGEEQHVYLPEVMEQQWQTNLERLRSYCEAA